MVEKSVKLSSKRSTPVEIISDAEVAGNLNSKKEFLLKKIAWEMMNPEYQKEKQRKPIIAKKKDPANKTAPSKKTRAIKTTESSSDSENKKRPGSTINYDILDKLFDAEKSPKRAKLEKPVVVVGDQMEPQGTEEEPDWNEDYSNEKDVYGRDEEFYGDANLEIEDQDEEEYDGEIIW